MEIFAARRGCRTQSHRGLPLLLDCRSWFAPARHCIRTGHDTARSDDGARCAGSTRKETERVIDDGGPMAKVSSTVPMPTSDRLSRTPATKTVISITLRAVRTRQPVQRITASMNDTEPKRNCSRRRST